MNEREIVEYGINALHKAGAQKAQCLLLMKETHELNVASDQVSLLRTTFDTDLHLTGIANQKKGGLSINQLDQDSIDQAAADVVALADSSKADPAYDIAEQQPAKEFHIGPEEPDRDLMYDKLTRFLAYCKRTYLKTILEEINFDFTVKRAYFQNSNGVDFTVRRGLYNVTAMFTSKDGKHSSSFNYSGFSARELDKDIQEYGTLDTLLKQSSEQMTTQMLPQKMTGDIIITPDCLGEFIAYITGYLRDYDLITGISIFKDKYGQQIADDRLTLHSRPVCEELAEGYFFTHDGYEAHNSTIIEHGVLRTFLLSLYGAKKTGKSRAVNQGGAYVIEPGSISLEKMMATVRNGILLCRFSGGNPSDNGNFSGVAKNSYYIQDGTVQYPLSETMIAGNLKDLLMNIRHISQERVNFGNAIFPWIQVRGITISGK